MNGEELDAARRALEALKAESRGAQAPERVERALAAAFRKRHAPARQPRWAVWTLGAAAAAAAAVVAMVAIRPAQAPPAAPKPAPVAEVKTEPPPQVAIAPAEVPRPKPRSAVRRRAARAPQPAAEQPEQAAFLPLPSARLAPPATEIWVTRMRLSRVSLAAAGLPVNMDRTDEAVLADVVFAGDGTARAVRILK